MYCASLRNKKPWCPYHGLIWISHVALHIKSNQRPRPVVRGESWFKCLYIYIYIYKNHIRVRLLGDDVNISKLIPSPGIQSNIHSVPWSNASRHWCHVLKGFCFTCFAKWLSYIYGMWVVKLGLRKFGLVSTFYPKIYIAYHVHLRHYCYPVKF